MLILAADNDIANTDRIRGMFKTFSGVLGAVDNFLQPADESS